MQKVLDILIDNPNLVTFMSLLTAYGFVYFLTARATFRSRLPLNQQRRIINNAKGILLLVSVISALVIWHTQIYSVIISLAALAAGLAIATKEVLLCIGGSFYRTSSRAFQVGDRIEIKGARGDVIEIGVFSTQILEVGPGDLTHQYTGRAVSIPNSQFLSHKIINETYSDDFVLHVFKVPVKNDNNWESHQRTLLHQAQKECNQYVDAAQKHFDTIARRKHVESPLLQPRVTVKITSPDTVTLVVRVTVPVRERGQIEQKILTGYLREIH
jgi:small-conductance mechanosensitive channel